MRSQKIGRVEGFGVSERGGRHDGHTSTPKTFPLSPHTHSIDLDTDTPPTLFRKTVLKGGYDPAADFETKQVFATSKDGTRVPMYVTAPKGVALDGSNPCLLYGYGGECKTGGGGGWGEALCFFGGWRVGRRGGHPPRLPPVSSQKPHFFDSESRSLTPLYRLQQASTSAWSPAFRSPASCLAWATAAWSRSPTCAAAASTASSGATRAPTATNKTCLTISRRAPSTWRTRGGRPPTNSSSRAAPTAACWSRRAPTSAPTYLRARWRRWGCTTCCASTSLRSVSVGKGWGLGRGSNQPTLPLTHALSLPTPTLGHAWCTDYGTPDDGDDFGVLLSYSPVHNVARPSGGGQYPAFMITTGDHDDRVVPLHSHKLTATLQHVMGGGDSSQRNPLITRIDVRAGHGAGKPTDKIIAEVADMYAYAAAVVGATWQAPE